MKNGLKFNLAKGKLNYNLKISYGKMNKSSDNPKLAAKKTAAGIVNEAKKNEIALLLENTYESLAMLESFISTKKSFFAITLSFKGRPNVVVDKWSDFLNKNGIELKVYEFDFHNIEQITILEKLQKETDCIDMKILFDLWTICQTDALVVCPGHFCLPQLAQDDSISTWGLPNWELLSAYDFMKQFGGEVSFFSSTYDLFLSQAQSDFSAALVELYRLHRRWVPDNIQLKELFYDYCGFSLAKKCSVLNEYEPLWQMALRYEGRKTQEAISKIQNRMRHPSELKVSKEEIVGEIKLNKKRNSGFLKLIKDLIHISEDINISGSAVALPAANQDEKAYALFPKLLTEYTYKGDLKKILKFIETQEFSKNNKNWITATDLHLHDELKDFTEFVKSKIASYFEKSGMAVYEYEITQCWANRAGHGEAHQLHWHPNSMLSGIFYLSDGGGSETIFVKDSPDSSTVFPTRTKETVWNSRTVRVRPQAGHLLIFPSDLPHQVSDHTDQNLKRYTIAFNVFVRGVIGDFNRGTWIDLRRTEN